MLEQHPLQIKCEPAEKNLYSQNIVPIADSSKNSVLYQISYNAKLWPLSFGCQELSTFS